MFLDGRKICNLYIFDRRKSVTRIKNFCHKFLIKEKRDIAREWRWMHIVKEMLQLTHAIYKSVISFKTIECSENVHSIVRKKAVRGRKKLWTFRVSWQQESVFWSSEFFIRLWSGQNTILRNGAGRFSLRQGGSASDFLYAPDGKCRRYFWVF